MARSHRPLTADVLQEEARFLLKTLLRDDLFGDHVSLTEAEKLLEQSLSVGFVEYCAFLKRNAYVDVDRARNTIAVLPRGKHVADGGADPQLLPMIAAHFQKQLEAGGGRVEASSRAERLPDRPEQSQQRVVHEGGGFRVESRRDEPARPSSTTKDLPLPPMSLPGRGEVDRYVRGEELGSGSMGVVARVKDTVLEREVVVKEVRHVFELVTYLPRDEIIRRVREAVMTQSKLDHPHVVKVVDVDFTTTSPTIVLEHAAGGSLRSRMGAVLLPVDVVLRLVLQASTALAAAHDKGVVHGGIKPENVLFDSAGNVRLSDFGIARSTERLPDPNTSAPPVYIGRGNTSYMAPEHLHKGELSPQGDIYAMGILLYELLTGTLPGRRSPMPSASERVNKHLGDAARSLDDLFDRMTRDPMGERMKSFDEVLSALYAILPKKNVVGRGTLLLYEKDWLNAPSDGPFDRPVNTGLESLPSGEAEAIEATDPSAKHRIVTAEP